ncbi:uncharacterized protein TrAtP1_004392 [Trichoderma atroviride]|uniref:uncharacterized protein n=1 Tax=Hypocrea atroviridis TaxID=63577 RepID=UPI003327B7C8|nr:hypothetical protein TrAtP1_004392 [Trichoderma atroviride]
MFTRSFLPLLTLMACSLAFPFVKRDCAFSADANDGDTCASLAAAWGITEAQFKSYNPSVKDCSALRSGSLYCVEWTQSTTTAVTSTSTSKEAATTSKDSPSPTQSGATSKCTKWVQQTGDKFCAEIAAANGVSLADFLKWNNIKADCSNLVAGNYECVAVSGTTKAKKPTSSLPGHGAEPGTISSCKKFHLIKSGDSCASIEKHYRITDAQFRKWNTELNGKCNNLWLNYNVCVGI